MVALLSFLLGGVTADAQGFLPEAALPLANSASGWTLVTALLVYCTRPPLITAAVLGAVSFVLLVLGYAAASGINGLYYNPLMFSLIGIVVGPFVGAAASWLRSRDLPAAVGTAILAGIGIGDAVYGLAVVSEFTGTTYWIVIGVAGLVLLAGMLAFRIRGVTPAAVAVAGTAIVAAAFFFAYNGLA